MDSEDLIAHYIRNLGTREDHGRFLSNLFARFRYANFCKKCDGFIDVDDTYDSSFTSSVFWYSSEVYSCQCREHEYEDYIIANSLKECAIIAYVENMDKYAWPHFFEELLADLNVIPLCYLCKKFAQYGYYDDRMRSSGYEGDWCNCGAYLCRSCTRNEFEYTYHCGECYDRICPGCYNAKGASCPKCHCKICTNCHNAKCANCDNLECDMIVCGECVTWNSRTCK